MPRKALVAGAGGFIGHAMVRYLKEKEYWVRGVDIKAPEFGATAADEFQLLDLRRRDNCLVATHGVEEVYQLAADMGGIGFITTNHAEIATNNVLINTHMLEAAWLNGVDTLMYSSSACVYPQYLQKSADVTPLKEEDCYPADAEEGYGWEKLYSEKLAQYYNDDGRVKTRVARFHNVFGPYGTYEGGREKAPAAICRKIALCKAEDEIEVWGDGEQTRSFMYIDDCLEGIYRIAKSDHSRPLNLGNDYLTTINGLVEIVAKIAGKTIARRHDLSAPQGVRGRNSDNTKLRELFGGWEPGISLEEGLKPTYAWIEQELSKAGRIPAVAKID